MDSTIKFSLTEHMKDFGLNLIGRGIANAITAEILTPYGHAMSIVNIAHGFEIVMKARIAEEHPLLIFSKLPKPNGKPTLELIDLLELGQTMMYSELPDRLWAITGYKIKNIDLYHKFGKVRNQIVHLTVPEIDLDDFALEFGFKVIEPVVNDWWDLTLLSFGANYDPEFSNYIFEQLKRLKLRTQYTKNEHGELSKKIKRHK